MGIADTKIPDKQPYKLAGKEYITTRGLNLYDFGARMHDPAAMRFSTPDPLMEQYPSLSPYTYCAANPLKYIDPTGMRLVNSATGKYSDYIENITSFLCNDIFFGPVMTFLISHSQPIDMNVGYIPQPKNGKPRNGSFDRENFKILLHKPFVNNDFEFPNRNYCYNALAEELYHAYQELNPESNVDNIEFEAHIAAFFSSYEIVGGTCYSSGINRFYDFIDPPKGTGIWRAFAVYAKLTLLYMKYQTFGMEFINGFDDSQPEHYDDPVDHMPKRLYNLIKNSYEHKANIDKSVLN